MKEIINVFSRHEIKYMITDEQRKALLKGIGDRMIPDPHGLSTICNIYYDTPDYRLIRRSLEKPEYKEKIRLRSYGTPLEDTIVFLELKKKFDGVVYKRRIELPEKDAERYMAGEMDVNEVIKVLANESDPQMVKEIDYFKTFYQNLKPSVYLSYDRCAYFSEEDDSLRITFDKNIRWRKENVKLTEATGGKELLKPNTSLMEIKTATALPVWLVKVLSEAKIRPSSFSKYGRAYQEILESRIAESALEEARALQEESEKEIILNNGIENKDTINERTERLGKENDEHIWKHIYGKRSYDTGLRDKSGSRAGAWSFGGSGLFVPQSAFKWISGNGGDATGNSGSDNHDGKRKYWGIGGSGRNLLSGKIPFGTWNR